MKKVLSVLLVICLFVGIMPAAFAANNVQDKTLSFNSDGKFKIVVINDFQEDYLPDVRSLVMLSKLLDTEKPDLVVLNGDQIDPSFPISNKTTFGLALASLLSAMELRHIPFIFTYGNHDAEKLDFDEGYISEEDMAGLYYSYRYCFAEKDGYDTATYNKLIYSSDRATPVLNIYMMNTGNWKRLGTMEEEMQSRVQWYKDKSDKLKAANGDEVLPSLLFQHIPVKETGKLLTRVDYDTPGATYTYNGSRYGYYILNDSLVSPNKYNSLGESINSGSSSIYTGEYDSWIEKGDIVCALFGHNHTNNFIGTTGDGITLGFNGGFGFGTYGNGNHRGAGVFVFDENDIENYEFYNVTYEDLFPLICKLESLPYVQELGAKLTDFLSNVNSSFRDYTGC